MAHGDVPRQRGVGRSGGLGPRERGGARAEESGRPADEGVLVTETAYTSGKKSRNNDLCFGSSGTDRGRVGGFSLGVCACV